MGGTTCGPTGQDRLVRHGSKKGERMGEIQNYVNGIKRDLEHVIPEDGHRLVKASIRLQAERLADIAQHNQKYLIQMMDEFLREMETRHNIVDFREYDCWDVVEHEQLMDEFKDWLR